jgi:hypothetical protein
MWKNSMLNMHKIFWLEHLKGRGYMEDLGIDERIILERLLGTKGGKVWIGFTWFRMGTGSGLV